MDEKPIGVIILVLLLILMGAVMLMNAFLGFSGGLFLGMSLDIPNQGMKLVSSVVGALLGMGVFGVAIGTFQMEGWAWKVSVILLVAAVLLNVLLMFVGGGLTPGLSLILSLGLLVYLTRPSIRSQFTQ